MNRINASQRLVKRGQKWRKVTSSNKQNRLEYVYVNACLIIVTEDHDEFVNPMRKHLEYSEIIVHRPASLSSQAWNDVRDVNPD